MKTSFLLPATVILSVSLFFTACQKEKGEETETDYNTETTTHTDDQSRFSNEIDAVSSDADLALEITSGFAGRQAVSEDGGGVTTDGIGPICDASIVIDTLSSPRTITITYDGTNCIGTRTRTGVVVLSMAPTTRWKNVGAVLNVSFQNFKVTRIADNKSITINGTQTYTNVNGGLLINLPTHPVTHAIASNNMSVTFDDGTQRTWQVARQRAFTYNNGAVCTTTGLHTEGNITGITEWGTNRFGNAFTTAITQPLVVTQACNFRLVSGKAVHKTSLYTAAVTFGLDAAGNATTCPGAGKYYFKLVWTGPLGREHSSIWPY